MAEELQKTALHPDEDEFLEVSAFTPDQIRQLIRTGQICDAKTLAGLYLLQEPK